MTFLESMIHSITHSTASQFEANIQLPYAFKIDETIELFKTRNSPKFHWYNQFIRCAP